MNWKPAFALVLFAVTLITFLGGIRLKYSTEGEGRKEEIKEWQQEKEREETSRLAFYSNWDAPVDDFQILQLSK